MKKPGNRIYSIQYLTQVLKEDLPALPLSTRYLTKSTVEDRLGYEPSLYGHPLPYSGRRHWVLKTGIYRIIYRIEPEAQTVLISAIRSWKEVFWHDSLPHFKK